MLPPLPPTPSAALHSDSMSSGEDFAFDLNDWPFEELDDLLRISEEADESKFCL